MDNGRNNCNLFLFYFRLPSSGRLFFTFCACYPRESYSRRVESWDKRRWKSEKKVSFLLLFLGNLNTLEARSTIPFIFSFFQTLYVECDTGASAGRFVRRHVCVCVSERKRVRREEEERNRKNVIIQALPNFVVRYL